MSTSSFISAPRLPSCTTAVRDPTNFRVSPKGVGEPIFSGDGECDEGIRVIRLSSSTVRACLDGVREGCNGVTVDRMAEISWS